MPQRKFTLLTLLTPLTLAALTGCTLQKQDGGEEYREAIPLREAMSVASPAESAAEGRTASAGDTRRAQAGGPAARDLARWYGFTRVVTQSVNVVTAAVLGSVWAIAHTEPTSIEDGEAIWGPHTDSLEPVTYRFRVTRVAPDEYDYVLEGRPKASSSDGDYRAVLSGHGYGKRHAEHGEGEFEIDLDVARELDPFAHAEDSGRVQVVHHLPHDIGSGGDALPRTIVATVTPDPSVDPEHFTVTSSAAEDGTGTLQVEAVADVDDTKTTALEDILVESRWRGDGAGRADIAISGGDVPADPGVVTAVECWGADFSRSYYSDSLGLEPDEGEASACVYDAP